MLTFLHRSFSDHRPDLLVIGGGPGGYVAAIRAAQLGLRTVCVEKEKLLGGACLREGCIPSKFLLNVAHKYHEVTTDFKKIGLNVGSVKCNMNVVQSRKGVVLATGSKGIELLFKKYGTIHEHGTAYIESPKQVVVTRDNGEKVRYNPQHILLATGSTAKISPDYPIDEDVICTSRGALSFKKVPKSLFVIGAGVIGLELGSVWSALGSKVSIADLAPAIGSLDKEAAQIVTGLMRKRNIDFYLGQKKINVRRVGDHGEVECGGKKMEVEKVLVSIGRIPYLEGMGFEKLGIVLNKNGTVKVDERFATNIPNIYAIGDIIPGLQLAHRAQEEGIACVEMIAGVRDKFSTKAIPSVIYTFPEIASVGLTEKEAKRNGIMVKVGSFPYIANSRARVAGDTAGFVKWICSEDGKVLGMCVVGANAGEAIVEGVIAIQNDMNIEQIAHSCHPHPTLSEAVMEAAKVVLGKAINY